MTLSDLPKLVTVFGGSGFVGRHVVRRLARRGYRVRVAVRRPDLAAHIQPLSRVGDISFVQANIRNRASIDRAVAGADYVVNLVGILYEQGRNTFDAVQDFGARAVAQSARDLGIGLTHMSAIGADANSPSDYGRTKALAEEAIFAILPDAVILRPSVIFGPEDSFYNKFADMAAKFPFLPLVGGGETKFQPVYVEDVAEVVARSVEGSLARAKIYELGGPQIRSMKEILLEIMEITRRDRILVPIPFSIASIIGSVVSLIPLITPPITADQVKLLALDNVVSQQAKAEGRTFQGLGIQPTLAGVILPTYLARYRPEGQFNSTGPNA